MRKTIRKITDLLTVLSIILFSTIIYYDNILPNKFYVNEDNAFEFDTKMVSVAEDKSDVSAVSTQSNKKSQMTILGIIPVKMVDVNYVEDINLIASGDAFGVKMFTDGPIVVDTATIETQNGQISPAKDAGIRKGDIITGINGIKITGNDQVIAIIEQNSGKTMNFQIKRNDEFLNTRLTPVLSVVDNKYKSGLWVRDSAAGIGTISFIDPKNDVFAGLGHPICDVDTGLIMSISSGEICKVDINSVIKGAPGTPGELSGVFSSDDPIGNIALNNQTGIYGQLFNEAIEDSIYPMAFKQEVEEGKATVLCRLTDDKKQEYDIEIISVDYNENNLIKNMIIQVTDEDLLKKTGGIVQGMSGTPIIQNGHIIGAVTHVFVNDPTKGYAIFAENMYDNSKTIEKYKINVAL